jgi:ATP-dependent RNA helicase DBP3
MTQDARNRSIEDFKKNNIPMLVATDVAGRGLDVQDVELVVNYTFPLTIEDYIHRIGRTGRAGKTGRSVTYFCPNDNSPGVDEKALAHDLVKVLADAKQEVPPELKKVADGAGGSKATKKKAHSLYGSHFKDEAEMAKLEEKKVHVTFDDSDDE